MMVTRLTGSIKNSFKLIIISFIFYVYKFPLTPDNPTTMATTTYVQSIQRPSQPRLPSRSSYRSSVARYFVDHRVIHSVVLQFLLVVE